MRKSGGEPMSCGYSPTPPAACAWSAHSPSKPTKTGSKPTATSIWTNCASRRKPNYAKPHDQHHDRQFAELDAPNRWLFVEKDNVIRMLGEFWPDIFVILLVCSLVSFENQKFGIFVATPITLGSTALTLLLGAAGAT